MHIQTHILSGWCVANLVPLTPRERCLAMVAAAAADLDGLGLVVSHDWYLDHHHVLGHNLAFGLVLSGVLTAFSTHRGRAAVLYLGLFHLHLVMDYFGSGFGWGIAYFWPWSKREFLTPHAWALFSWQNLTAFGLLLAWTVGIVVRRGRTPLEALMPGLDRQLVAWFRRWRGRAP
jgi:inner membrane protein